ncbi:hypothetical protein EPL05_09030 [Mucilaginibacter gilvus]|uniref:Uncharacterized protein n=2 Tax=Mucilaginibacter gilvus TaxID=2305909 RepID=A0A444MRD0_9SPHI|nr:hypothetical protein EPL05_09030 [Mucilaginibacter gilvus]
MDKCKLLLTILILSLCSCHTELIENLRVVNNLYVDKDGTLYDGVAKGYFDPGELSGKTTFNHGVPEGDWTSYGHNGEIVQTGNSKVYYPKFKTIGPAKDVVRVNVNIFHEGNNLITEVFIINNSFINELIKQKDPTLFNKIIALLKSNNIPIDIKQVYRITFVKGELEKVD